jgi:hypothetical protein
MTSERHAFHLRAGYQSFGRQAVTAPRNAATTEVRNMKKKFCQVFHSQPKHMLIAKATYTTLLHVWAFTAAYF